MVFLVNHSCEGFPAGDDGASRPLGERMMPAYKMALDEEPSVEDGRLIDADVEDFVAQIQRHQDVF